MSLSSKERVAAERNKAGRGQWHESMLGIMYVVDDTVQFSDDWDHWRNGFCRLLEISEEKAKAFIENAVAAAHDKQRRLLSELPLEQRLECIKESTHRTLYGGNVPAGEIKVLSSWGTDLEGSPANTIFAHSISGNTTRFVVGNTEHEFAWLIDPTTNQPVPADTIVYDTAYFSSGTQAHYGMKHYLQQSDWRLEKSRRLVKSVMQNIGERAEHWLAKPNGVDVLDVGSAVGYFRKAFSEYGFNHYGTELSTDMIEEAQQRFGFDTWYGGISQIDELAKGKKFQIITLWDTIEHLSDVEEQVQVLKKQLSEDGVLVVRTPNLVAFEADVLGDYYYSYKLEHIIFFSPKSLNKMMANLGLEPIYVDTDSHIFKGLLGADYLFKQGKALKGADILAVYGRKQG